ncbi:Egg-laying hormone precursor [Prosthecobacter debontii]|uniref:Egg-laying hormone n=1 Tax=Prosthecobacter debontii TaxID=48467 RepID=A0A1T4YGS0_9BACT|nr:hypothetical protein [Prosthecobacter debontii]SKB01032.1 Egg-laying hormone precursor [Prosthecobacter debontii]
MKSILTLLCAAVAALTLSNCSTYVDGTPVYSYRNPHYSSTRVIHDRRYDNNRHYSSRYRRSSDRYDRDRHDHDHDRRTVRYRRGVDTRVNANVSLFR